MTASHLNVKTILVPVVMFLLLNACGTTAPTRFYLLHPPPSDKTASEISANGKIAIALLPVRLPEHLNRPQIVSRQEDHQIKVDEFNRWAEPLDASFTTTLVENLSQILNTERISVSNRMKNTDYDYSLMVNVIRFDGQIGKQANLICRWSIYSGDGKTGLTVKRSSIKRQVEGSEYKDLVAAMSLLVGDLSREIAAYFSNFH